MLDLLEIHSINNVFEFSVYSWYLNQICNVQYLFHQVYSNRFIHQVGRYTLPTFAVFFLFIEIYNELGVRDCRGSRPLPYTPDLDILKNFWDWFTCVWWVSLTVFQPPFFSVLRIAKLFQSFFISLIFNFNSFLRILL